MFAFTSVAVYAGPSSSLHTTKEPLVRAVKSKSGRLWTVIKFVAVGSPFQCAFTSVMDRFRDAVNQAAALAPGAAGGTEQEAVKAANRATR